MSEKTGLLVWVGRFKGNNGYATVTKNMFNMLKERDFNVLGVDINSLDVFGKKPKNVELIKHKDNVEFRVDTDQIVNVVIHDCPDRWSSVEAVGRVCVHGYTVAETNSLPLEWQDNLTSVHRLWTASNFNKDIYSEHTPYPIEIVHHPVDVDRVDQSQSRLKINGLKSFVILLVVSNFNRKDISAAIRAYARAFRPEDDVTLLVKLPGNSSEKDIQKFIWDPAYPELDLNSDKLPQIVFLAANLSTEDIFALYALSDLVISTERAKGFDLICAEAMAANKPVIAVGWSANLEFMNTENSILLDPLPKLVPAEDCLVSAHHLYGASKWSSFSIDDLCEAMRWIRDNPDEAALIALKGREDVRNLLCESSISAQVSRIISEVSIWETCDYKKPKVRVWQKGRDRLSETAELRQKSWEELTYDEKELFTPVSGESPVSFIERRRPLWRKYGVVLPPQSERARVAKLKDRYHGKPIIIMGNGPSLKKIDFDKLVGTTTFNANRISLIFDKTQWRPTYFTALDWLVTPDNYEEYEAIDDEIVRFLPMRFSGLLSNRRNTYWYESTASGRRLHDKFQTDASDAIRGGGTVVTAMLQLAWHLGYRRFYLLGCDANYQVKHSVQQSGGDIFGTGIQKILKSTEDDDPNHFDPRYFGSGKYWHDPNVDEMKRGFYSCYKFIENNGGRLLDATEGGKLSFIPKVNIDEILENEEW